MLILGRKTGQGIVIGDVITVQVGYIGPESAELRLDAPMNLTRRLHLSSDTSFASRTDRFAGGYELPANQQTVTLWVGQSTQFEETVRIILIRIHGAKVRLAIHAPRDLCVCREEVFDAFDP